MTGIYCSRCQTNVKLEQDGRRCSNCGKVLVIPAPQPPPRAPVSNPKPPARRPRAKAGKAA
ncbi:MAG: hypothetical protein A2W34_03985 [Chloroflexi bacterium RBG_16_64_32]|nr:MAG: hypothetical protein A2W34_03985 [Chloroflexi bacterium RBG_16_64_32]